METRVPLSRLGKDRPRCSCHPQSNPSADQREASQVRIAGERWIRRHASSRALLADGSEASQGATVIIDADSELADRVFAIMQRDAGSDGVVSPRWSSGAYTCLSITQR